MKKIPVTLHGHKKMTEELERLKHIERPQIIAAIAEARAHGDFKEKTPNITRPKKNKALLKDEFVNWNLNYRTVR